VDSYQTVISNLLAVSQPAIPVYRNNRLYSGFTKAKEYSKIGLFSGLACLVIETVSSDPKKRRQAMKNSRFGEKLGGTIVVAGSDSSHHYPRA